MRKHKNLATDKLDEWEAEWRAMPADSRPRSFTTWIVAMVELAREYLREESEA